MHLEEDARPHGQCCPALLLLQELCTEMAQCTEIGTVRYTEVTCPCSHVRFTAWHTCGVPGGGVQELLLPPEEAGFISLRVALRDVDDEDISAHFDSVCGFIEVGHAGGFSGMAGRVRAYLPRCAVWMHCQCRQASRPAGHA